MDIKASSGTTLTGTGVLRQGQRTVGTVKYFVHITLNGQADLVKFEPRPPVRKGDRVHLTLEDGRFLTCQILDGSSYCAVVGDGPTLDRRQYARN